MRYVRLIVGGVSMKYEVFISMMVYGAFLHQSAGQIL